jgi:hypothetical protein
MAGSTVAKLGAGSKLYYERPAAPGVFILLDNALNIGEVGEQGEFIETTPISKTVREYVKGLQTPPSKTIGFNDQPGEAVYAQFLTDWEASDSINFRVDYTNNHRAAFALIPNGRVMDEPQGSTQLIMRVFAQQSGGTTWSVI